MATHDELMRVARAAYALGWRQRPCGGPEYDTRVEQALAALVAREAGDTPPTAASEPESDEAEFELSINGNVECGASGPRAKAWREIQHYAAQYALDGDEVQIYQVTRKVTRKLVQGPPTAASEPAPEPAGESAGLDLAAHLRRRCSAPAESAPEGGFHAAHERTCRKAPHDNPNGGYLHGESDDSPYWVDGLRYCGRCHYAIDGLGRCSPKHATAPAPAAPQATAEDEEYSGEWRFESCARCGLSDIAWPASAPGPVTCVPCDKVDAAVAAEREACARIAEEGALVPPDGGAPTESERALCSAIARDIRTRKSG